jgi:hypothetical protein
LLPQRFIPPNGVLSCFSRFIRSPFWAGEHLSKRRRILPQAAGHRYRETLLCQSGREVFLFKASLRRDDTGVYGTDSRSIRGKEGRGPLTLFSREEHLLSLLQAINPSRPRGLRSSSVLRAEGEGEARSVSEVSSSSACPRYHPEAGTIQEYRKTLSRFGKKGRDGFTPMKEVEYWGLVALVGERKVRIKIVLRRVGGGSITFRSVMLASKASRADQKQFQDEIEDG